METLNQILTSIYMYKSRIKSHQKNILVYGNLGMSIHNEMTEIKKIQSRIKLLKYAFELKSNEILNQI